MLNKITVYLLVVVLLFFSTSCLDIVEEMHLNKDGSGRYELVFDMSSIMSGGMLEMLKGMAGDSESSGENILDGPLEMDTVIYMKDAPASVREKLDRPDFLNKVSMFIQMSEEKEVMITRMVLDFDSMDDIDYFYKNLDKLGEGNDQLGDVFGGNSFLPISDKLFKLKGKLLERLPVKNNGQTLNEEEMDMVKMMLASAKYTTKYHFPGKVKSSTIANAKIDGKTLIKEVDLLDVMEGKANMAGKIKFKKR